MASITLSVCAYTECCDETQYVYSTAGCMALIESYKAISEASVLDIHIYV
jgi:hypothetical protein